MASVDVSDSLLYLGSSSAVAATTTIVGTVVAPAVAPAIALSAVTVAAGYVGLTLWCEEHASSGESATWYQSSVEATSKGMELTVDAHGRTVG